MKYFEFNVASYQGKTAHLSLAEHGAYMLMMMTFYASEKALPADRRVLYRLLRAESPAERKAIDRVAGEFWSESNGKLTNPRCEETLARYLDWVSKQRMNGSKGGRPKETHGLSDGEPNANPNLKPNGTHGKANGGDRARVLLPTSDSENDLRLPTHTSDSESDAPATAARARGRGDRKRGAESDSGWRPPTEEEISAGL